MFGVMCVCLLICLTFDPWSWPWIGFFLLAVFYGQTASAEWKFKRYVQEERERAEQLWRDLDKGRLRHRQGHADDLDA
jgi:uncharacterized membrane protein